LEWGRDDERKRQRRGTGKERPDQAHDTRSELTSITPNEVFIALNMIGSILVVVVVVVAIAVVPVSQVEERLKDEQLHQSGRYNPSMHSLFVSSLGVECITSFESSHQSVVIG
jgi:hypothetical protein